MSEAAEDPAELRAAADELESAAGECRERAEQLQEAGELANQAVAGLKELAEHEEVSDELAVKLDLLREMLGMLRHGEQWGLAASYYRSDARRKESDAEWRRQKAGQLEKEDEGDA